MKHDFSAAIADDEAHLAYLKREREDLQDELAENERCIQQVEASLRNTKRLAAPETAA